MAETIKVPGLPESVSDAVVAVIHKQVGDYVREGDNLIDLETDKVMLEVPATETGKIKSLHVKEGDVVVSDAPLMAIEVCDVPDTDAAPVVEKETVSSEETMTESSSAVSSQTASPSARRMMDAHQVSTDEVQGTGHKGRITKDDVQRAVQGAGSRKIERVPMTRIRARIAERLLEVQSNAALLSTFNEVNMQAVMDLRAKYKTSFQDQHGTKLGFMSFFVKATVAALEKFPVVNATLDAGDVLYHHYCDIGIAVASSRGLVVPVLRNAEHLQMHEIEQSIRHYAESANNGRLKN